MKKNTRKKTKSARKKIKSASLKKVTNSQKISKAKKLIKRPTRFVPDPMTVALIDYEMGAEFNPFSAGIVDNESYGGCAIVLSTNNQIHSGQKIKIKVGHLDPMMANIVWVKKIKEKIYRVGIKYLE